MKCKIPEISWHNRDPVLSVDIQPKTGNDTNTTIYRLASGGTDAHVLIWYMNLHEHDITLDLAADLTRHQRAVNAVKWSPNGELLASGDDESVVFIWKLKAENEPLNIVDTTNEQDKEVWITLKVLRGHMEDIYDLCWAPNSQFLVSGSVDNSAMIWDVHKGKYTAMLTDHKGFVQGVTWDPKNQYIATLSTDRYLRIFDIQTKRVVQRINKSALPVPEGHQLHGHRMRLFHDDTLQTFFRRLCFTPDGNLLLTPAGVTDYEGATKPVHTTYAFSRYAFKQPAIVLPCSDQYTVAVSCCPLLFCLRAHNAERNPPVVPLPYRMIFAVATRSSVYFYDTQQRQPFGLISNIHYTRLTDITWSSDGRIVVVSSTDGFCSMITFEQGELGEIYEDSAAVLGAAINTDMPAASSKKSKNKQKENDLPGQAASMQSNKSRKASTDETPTTGVTRAPLLEKVTEIVTAPAANEQSESTKSLQCAATPIAIRRKKNAGSDTIAPNAKDEAEKANEPITVDKIAATQPVEAGKSDNNTNAATPIAIRRKGEPKKMSLHTATTIADEKASNGTPASPARTAKTQATTNKLTKEANHVATAATETQGSGKDDNDTTATRAAPTPIAISRKSEAKKTADQQSKTIADEKVNDGTPTASMAKQTIAKVATAATPNALHCKPKPAEAVGSATETPKLPLPADIIIDKEILSTDEKFESPEKKSRPVTPISVRRQPRTPNSAAASASTSTGTPLNASKLAVSNQSPLSSKVASISSPQQHSKRATPIAVRRTPRALIPPKSQPTPVNAPAVGEEAMDAWPLDVEMTDVSILPAAPETPKAAAPIAAAPAADVKVPPAQNIETTCDKTEDMRLVYEDTVEESMPAKSDGTKAPNIAPSAAANDSGKADTASPNAKQQTPGNNKTPRRVPLRTISTPKSKKKLLD